MSVILRQLQVDPVTLRVTMDIQFSESGPVETRHATYVIVGDNGWKLDCEDDLIDRLQKTATQAELNFGAIAGQLLIHVRDALHYPDRLWFPISLEGLQLNPDPLGFKWTRLKSLMISGRSLWASTPGEP